MVIDTIGISWFPATPQGPMGQKPPLGVATDCPEGIWSNSGPWQTDCISGIKPGLPLADRRLVYGTCAYRGHFKSFPWGGGQVDSCQGRSIRLQGQAQSHKGRADTCVLRENGWNES